MDLIISLGSGFYEEIQTITLCFFLLMQNIKILQRQPRSFLKINLKVCHNYRSSWEIIRF